MTKQFSSVWLRAPRTSKRAGLRRDQIVAAAVELLDAEGLEALSMRKLGAKLNAGATSLYWHVANKDELLELALDEFWGLIEVPEPDHASSWRAVITTFAYSLRATMLDHLWVGGLIGRMPMVGPNAFERTDRLRRTFVRAGFSGLDLHLATGTVMGYVLGQVLPEITLRRASGGEWDYDGAVAAMEQLADGYPDMLAEYRQAVPSDPVTARMIAYDFGLLCVLDGLAARLPAQQHDAVGEPD